MWKNKMQNGHQIDYSFHVYIEDVNLHISFFYVIKTWLRILNIDFGMSKDLNY